MEEYHPSCRHPEIKSNKKGLWPVFPTKAFLMEMFYADDWT
jgi:hypothetical protein